jgi:hypothetical protein
VVRGREEGGRRGGGLAPLVVVSGREGGGRREGEGGGLASLAVARASYPSLREGSPHYVIHDRHDPRGGGAVMCASRLHPP